MSTGTYWLEQLELAGKNERKWRKRAKKVLKRYKDERDEEVEEKKQFNILWSTTETLKPALMSAVPRPEVRQRYKKNDPIARMAAKILERALEFSLDNYDFVNYGKAVVHDFLLPGRGVSRVDYIPTFEKKKGKIPLKMKEEGGETVFYEGKNRRDDFQFDEDGGAFVEGDIDELVFEEVRGKRVPWKWFRIQPADCWENVNWIAFGAPYTKDEGIIEFGSKFNEVEVAKSETEENENKEDLKDKIIVWEIWDKRTRKQIFMAENHDFKLEENKDPLGLEGFWPIPEPIYAVDDFDTNVPTPEFILWQDQADELDELTARIARVTTAIKARGAYAGETKHELSQILEADDNELVGVEDWMSFADKGGLDGVISWVPIEQFAKVLQILEGQRAVKVQEIFELTGVGDIARGASDPRETARAQTLKANMGSRRLLPKQKSVQNHFRDLYRIKAEIIAEHFDKETLRLMVGLEGDNQVFDQAVEMIKNDALRMFSVDIETESTIAADEEREKQGLAEGMQAISGYVAAILPAVQSGFIPRPVAMGILHDYLRKFRFGRKLDDLLEEAAQQPAQPDPAQAAQQQQQQQQMEQQKAQFEAEMQKMQLEFQMKQKETETKLQAMAAEFKLKARAAKQELDQDDEVHAQELAQEEERHEQEMEQMQEKSEVTIETAKALGKAKEAATREQGKQKPVNKPSV